MTSGTQVTDFVPVSFVARCLLDSCLRPDIQAGIPLVVNIGSGISKLARFRKVRMETSRCYWVSDSWNYKDRHLQVSRCVPDLSACPLIMCLYIYKVAFSCSLND